MPSPPPLEIILETGEEVPGKHKRNRTRVSCINCYASKRKCDRKRPCTRCIQLGLTGLCVYELDDPSLRNKKNFNENAHLKNRIAELESLLRQLKDKPHPRWTAQGGLVHDPGLVAERRRSRRHVRGDSIRSASVETFFAAGAESDDEEDGIKVEQESSFIPEFTPSEDEYHDASNLPSSPQAHELGLPELEYPDEPALDTEHPPRLISAPFAFVDEQDAGTPPISSFVQGMPTGVTPLFSPKSRLNRTNPFHARSSTESPTLSTLGDRGDAVIVSRTPLPSLFGGSTANSVDTLPVGESLLPLQQPSSDVEHVCRCLNASALLTPLLHLAVTLRTSREALQHSHTSTTDCEFFRRIVVLEDHIFSAAPPTPKLSRTCDTGSRITYPSEGVALAMSPRVVDPTVEHLHTTSFTFPSSSAAPSTSFLDNLPPIYRYDTDAFSHLAEPSNIPYFPEWP